SVPSTLLDRNLNGGNSLGRDELPSLEDEFLARDAQLRPVLDQLNVVDDRHLDSRSSVFLSMVVFRFRATGVNKLGHVVLPKDFDIQGKKALNRGAMPRRVL